MLSFPISLCVLFAFVARVASSAYTTISTGAELKAFADEVNAGTNYRGLTVSLTADIDLAGINYTCPGGVNEYATQKSFQGTFEGNGHAVKNMVISSSELYYIGLFGYSNGCTIRNVVIDSSCSLTNTRGSQFSYAAGVVAYANAGASEVKILNCVNMATITGGGKISRMGGIAGIAYAFAYSATIAGCVNMGAIVQPETDDKLRVGGIVGIISEESGKTSFVYNCVNMGTVTSSPVYKGGIVGLIPSKNKTAKWNYWLNGTAPASYFGATSAAESELFYPDYKLPSGEPLVDKLNDYVSTSDLGLRTWSTVTFDANGGSLAPASSGVAMLVLIGAPGVPAKEQGTFEGWFADPTFTKKWHRTMTFDGNATLYAKWTMNRFTVSFNTAGVGEIAPATAEYGNAVPLEVLSRTGYAFLGWADDAGNTFTGNYTINRAENVTLTAKWEPVKYSVSFVCNGNATNVLYEFGETVTAPAIKIDEGYILDGWFTDTSFANKFVLPAVMGAENITLYAKLIEKNTYAKIQLNKVLTKAEQEELSKVLEEKYDGRMTIIRFEDSGEETLVIVKFVDPSAADELYRDYKDGSGVADLIKRIDFLEYGSFGKRSSAVFSLLALLALLL